MAEIHEWHQPVLVDRVLHWLAPQPGMQVVDATVGDGGHAAALLAHLLPGGRLWALDRDPEAVRTAEQRLQRFRSAAVVVQGNFRRLRDMMDRLKLEAVDGLLFDLGVSSRQLAAPRGFSFQIDSPLDMRFDPSDRLTGEKILRTASQAELEKIFRDYGQERLAARLARRIVRARAARPIRSADQLAGLIERAVPGPRRRPTLSRVFQALRIAVNAELEAVEAALAEWPDCVKPGGRIAVLSYHSLEDGLAKRAFAGQARRGLCTVLTPKPERPAADEVEQNPRSRSARLRAAERR